MPYRINAREPEPEIKIPMKFPSIVFVFMTAASFAGMGLGGEYFSRGLPEGHASVASVGVVICFLTLALYFGFRAILKIKNEVE